MRSIFILIISFFSCSLLHAQDKSNRGKEFWLSYGFDYTFFWESPVNGQEMALYISTEQAATVTVSITNTSYTQTLTIPANTVDATILIPKSGANDARTLTDGLQNRNIHIVSTVPVAVYSHVYATQVSGATMLMPVETYGYSYYSINYYQTTSQSNPADWYCWFYAIASEDNTRLEITPSDTTKNGWLPGQTYTVNLNKGESFHVFGKAIFNVDPSHASKDLTGSKVISVPGGDGNCHPFALFSGSGGIRLCRGDGGEFMQQQVFPSQAWGTRYLTYHSINNFNTDILETNRNYYRVCVLDPTAVVKRNGVVLTGLIKNFFYEFMDSTGGDYIESDKPILVAQYTPNDNQCWGFNSNTYGDPEMFYLSPIEQGQKSVLFYVSRKSAIDFVYLTVHFPTIAVNSLKFDGAAIPAAQIIPHPNFPSYSVALVRIPGAAAQHTISCDSALTATVYGLGSFESYGYNVGTLINNLNNYSGIKNTNNTNGQTDTFTCRNTPVRLFVKLAYPATSIHWKLSQVAGISPNVDSIIANPIPVTTELIYGRTYYIYTLQQDFIFANTGTFNIPVTYTSNVIQNCSQTENANVRVVVKAGPIPDFFSSTSACPNIPVLLTGASQAGIFTLVNYLWTFDDATTQNTLNAVKSFPTIGGHPVRYQAFADNGCVGDTIKTVIIGAPITLLITATGKLCADSVQTFTSSVPPDASNPPSWYWDFGDGNTTTITNSNTVSHSYTASASTRTVRHAVSFTTGCGTDTVQYIIPSIKANPVSSFSYLTDTLCEKIPVQFNSSLTGVATWAWNFGNGTSNTAPPFYHTYNTAGTYNVSLVITDMNGCGSLAAINPVIIKAPPAINAGPDKTITSIGGSTTLDATIVNPGNYDFLWTPSTFLSSTTVLNPVSTPDRKITYTITATDRVSNCSASDSVMVIPISFLIAPNAFTPNNDGLNDIFRILGTGSVTKFNMRIFNRYGETVFETNDKSKGWDGMVKGKAAQPGGYVYIVKYNASNYNDAQVFQGSFVLIR